MAFQILFYYKNELIRKGQPIMLLNLYYMIRDKLGLRLFLPVVRDELGLRLFYPRV